MPESPRLRRHGYRFGAGKGLGVFFGHPARFFVWNLEFEENGGGDTRAGHTNNRAATDLGWRGRHLGKTCRAEFGIDRPVSGID